VRKCVCKGGSSEADNPVFGDAPKKRERTEKPKLRKAQSDQRIDETFEGVGNYVYTLTESSSLGGPSGGRNQEDHTTPGLIS